MNRFIYILLAIICLSGCATPYKPNGLWGGYSDMALNQDTYKVSFRGNGFTSAETTQDYLLRRSAELTLQKGYKYFVIFDENTSVDTEICQAPTTVDVNGDSNDQINANRFSSSHTSIYPGAQEKINRYTAHAVIKIFKSNKNVPQAFEATTVLSNFKK